MDIGPSQKNFKKILAISSFSRMNNSSENIFLHVWNLNYWCMEIMKFDKSVFNCPYENILYTCCWIFNLSKCLGFITRIFLYLILRQVFHLNFLSPAINSVVVAKVYLISMQLGLFLGIVFLSPARFWHSI